MSKNANLVKSDISNLFEELETIATETKLEEKKKRGYVEPTAYDISNLFKGLEEASRQAKELSSEDTEKLGAFSGLMEQMTTITKKVEDDVTTQINEVVTEFVEEEITHEEEDELREFVEELKRLKIKIVRPSINQCFAEFKAEKNIIYYGLGAIKNVGFEAISNIVKERINNGLFNSIHDFLNRVNPKDINKLQLEGLVKAGAFDNINSNRKSLFDSIPSFITKSKNIFENKSANQIDLFSEDENHKNEILSNTKDWKFEERLSKEFEAVGFFISDHPLNQYKEVFNDYMIKDYQTFNNDNEVTDSNVAATLLKIQERKTARGNAYAVLKLTDLNSVFELFVFSDILDLNREILLEGNSFILSLIKSTSDNENRFKRINVKKISSLKDLLNKPLNEVKFNIKSINELEEISKYLDKKGNTLIKINLSDQNNNLNFELENKRNIDRKSVNLIRNKEISAIIS